MRGFNEHLHINVPAMEKSSQDMMIILWTEIWFLLHKIIDLISYFQWEDVVVVVETWKNIVFGE